MHSPKDNPRDWSETELRLIRERELFLHKYAILQKAEERLQDIKTRMIGVLAEERPRYLPSGTDLERGKITRGENNKGFPFISLDIPQFFTKEEYFTYRILFWWGHYLGYSLVLKGPRLAEYYACLQERRHEPRFADIHIARHTSPWEWENSEGGFSPVQQPSNHELGDWVEAIQYIKVIRMFPVDAPGFTELDWTREGVRTYADLIRLTQK